MFGLLFAAALGAFLWRALTVPFKGYSEPVVRVEIKRGWNSSTILSALRKSGVLRDDFVPLLYMKALRRNASLKAGVYEFDHPLSAVDVLDKLIRADVIQKSITIREGLDRFVIAELMSKEGFGKRSDWLKLTADPEMIKDIDPRAVSLEGFLFPDTYKLTPGTSAAAVVALMIQNFRKNWGEELAFISSGLDVHDTVTLASVVETEAQRPEERPIVASVYLNRTRRNMPLQADPTVIYAMKLAGRWNGNIRKADLQAESPYNTYTVRGFPPGPIANPGLASLRAAAAPASTSFLYFVSKNDGSHVFATSLDEHNRNVLIHQKRFFKDQAQTRTASP